MMVAEGEKSIKFIEKVKKRKWFIYK